MTYTAEGFILRKEERGEYDCLYTIFTFQYGKRIVLGQGVRKSRSKLCGNLEPISRINCSLAKGRLRDRIIGVDMRNRYLDIKQDLTALSLALYLCEVFDQLIKEDASDHELYALLDGVFSALSHSSPLLLRIRFAHGALCKMGSILGLLDYTNGVMRALTSARSLEQFAKSLTPTHARIVRQHAHDFVSQHCERFLGSQVFFDYYESQVQTKDQLT